jgi:hypothetical protein
VSRKYIRQADADRVLDTTRDALAALGEELVLALGERITPRMTAAEIEALAEAEIKQMLGGVDQIEAAMNAWLDDAAIGERDDG